MGDVNINLKLVHQKIDRLIAQMINIELDIC